MKYSFTQKLSLYVDIYHDAPDEQPVTVDDGSDRNNMSVVFYGCCSGC